MINFLLLFHYLQSVSSVFITFPSLYLYQFSSVAQSCPTLCDSVNRSTPGLPVHHQLPEFTQTHVHWVSDAIQPSHPVIPFSSCPQSIPASGSFQMSQLFESGGQSIGVSASTSVPPMNTQDWSPLGWTGWISLQSKGLSRVFSNTTVSQLPKALFWDSVYNKSFPSLPQFLSLWLTVWFSNHCICSSCFPQVNCSLLQHHLGVIHCTIKV